MSRLYSISRTDMLGYFVLGYVVAYLQIGLIDIRQCFIAVTLFWENDGTNFIYLIPSVVSPNFVKY